MLNTDKVPECPYCGDTDAGISIINVVQVNEKLGNGIYFVECNNCPTTTEAHLLKKDALKAFYETSNVVVFEAPQVEDSFLQKLINYFKN